MGKMFRIAAASLMVAGSSLAVIPEEAKAMDIGNCWVSTVCTYNDINRTGHKFTASGYNSYTALDAKAINRVSSWANANNYQNMYLGDWVNNRKVSIGWLKANYYENWVGAGSNDRADFVAHG